MCGIVGAIGYLDEHICKSVKEMNRIQRHRGPDGDGVWVSNDAGIGYGASFAHRRLAIIDLSSGANQPMIDELTSNTLVFNGEIYNYLELQLALEKEGVKFHSSSDTEVILHAYRVWGKSFIHRLRGMFTIVIWDAESRKTFMYRDRLGIKPLYYTVINRGDKKTLLFSSEIKTLIESGLIRRKLNPAGVESFIWNGFVAGGSTTIVQGVFQLEAGYQMIVDDHGGIQDKSEFWEFPLFDSNSKRSSVEEVKDELETSIKLHLASDVPLGVFLSGGIDSSAVAALAVQQGHDKVATYNLAFEEKEYSEAQYAKSVAERLGTEHHEVVLTQTEFLNSLDDAMCSMDQPSFDGINTYFISREIRNAGITVALAGTGGDELFGGYRSFSDVPNVASYSNWFSNVPEKFLNHLTNFIGKGLKCRYGDVPPQTRWGKISDIIQTQGDVFSAFQTSYALYTQDFFNQLLTSDERHNIYGVEHSLASHLTEKINRQPSLSQISTLELHLFIKERLMRDTDAASMAASLEVRVPLLDHVLLEKVTQLDLSTRFSPVGKKQLLRELAMPEMDAALFERPKSGFVLPFDRWCRDALQSDVEELLNNKSLCESVGLNSEAVSALNYAFKSNAKGIYWSRIWAIYAYLWWCQKHQMSI